MPKKDYQDWRRFSAKANRQSRYLHPKIYGKTPKIEVPKELFFNKHALKALLLFGVLGGIIWFIFGSSYFKIKEINIVGSVTASVKSEIDALEGKNLLTYSAKGMTEKIKTSQSSIKDLNIYKGFPDALRVEVVMRDPQMSWKSQGKTYLIDADGVAFQAAEGELVTFENKLPEVIDPFSQPVKLGNKLVSKGFIEFVKELGNSFEKRMPIKIKEIQVGETTLEVAVVTDKGWKALFSTTRSPEAQLDALIKIVEQFHDDIKEYVDLRISGRAYYK